ncbi:MAG: FAD-dependent oxidoreductase, partial [Firmicutes bacterium]|nr:FAD-dependent oxidoreductase [Bacillota bacterium]
LAPGSKPRPLGSLAFDATVVMNSDNVLDRETIPATITIVGAGAIGVEFASMYNDFGSRVTLIEYAERILPAEDHEISDELTKTLKKRGIDIITQAQLDVKTVEVHADQGFSGQVRLADGRMQTVQGEALLVAIGRMPATEEIGCDAAGVVRDHGFITVNAEYQTSVPHIYAIGDAIGGLLLAHVAAHEGTIAIEHMAGLHPDALDLNRVPRVTYSRPEVASMGLSEEQAKQAGHTVKVGRFPFRANGKSLILGEAEGFVKIIADAQDDTLLGAHLIGPHASDLINELALAKYLDAAPWEIGESVHAHPTVAEVLRESALDVDDRAIHI